ncbi:MAG: hypothetical protein WCO10_01825 [bacterium]
MFNISLYLNKFKNIGQDERRLKEVIVATIKELVGVDIGYENVTVKKGEAVIAVSPAYKNAIYIKKEKILKSVSDQLGRGVGNIR